MRPDNRISGSIVPSAKKPVLCVDDDPETLQVRRMLLESSGYRVLTAASGVEAVELMRSQQAASLVVLDYLMPGMNGDELAKTLRRDYPTVPLLAFSAVGQLPDSLLRNVDAHLQKGEDPEVFLLTVAELLRRREERSTKRHRVTVLCVEDEELQLKLRRLLFEGAGYEVLEAMSGAAALELFGSNRVNAVLMDFSLSGGDGSSLAIELKKMRPEVPIIVLSGSAAPATAQEGVDRWLRKVDVEPEDLLATVESLIPGGDQS